MEQKIEITAACIRCGHCVKVCPTQVFWQATDGAGAADKTEEAPVVVQSPGDCMACGHCVAVCPQRAIVHGDFPVGTVHPIDRAMLPTPDQVELLIASRRSNRALSTKPIPPEVLQRIVEAANRAPTATNAQQLGYTLVTDPAELRRITEFTLGIFGKIVRVLSNPLVKPWLSRLKPAIYRYESVFRSMEREFAEGTDRILRGATAVLFIHAPKASRFGAEDANLAYQNASLMAEALGVSQIYMGFVLTATRQKPGALEAMLGLADRRICAIQALGLPQFRYLNYVDRKRPQVQKL